MKNSFRILLMCVFITLVTSSFPTWAQENVNPSEVEFEVEENGTIVAARAETQFGVKDDCSIGLVLVGPQNDSGWSQAHYEALVDVTEAAGCSLQVFESLNPADSPGTTLSDVATQMIDAGADMIIATSDAFEEDSNTIAREHPDVVILNMTGSNRLTGEAPDNLANSNGMFEAPRFVAGCAAVLKAFNAAGGSLAEGETISIGFVGPLINFETRRHQSSSYLGARHCAEKLGLDPDTQLVFEVTWIGFWFYIPGVTLDPTEVASTFFDRGFQVVISGIDTTEPLVVAQQRQERNEEAWTIGTDNVKACAVAPKACLGEQFYDWRQTYGEQIQALQNGTWTARWELRAPNWENFKSTDPAMTTIGFDMEDTLTEEEQAFLDSVIAELAEETIANPGMIPGWRGPLNLQDGTPLQSDDEFVNPFEVWFLPQLLEGMIGPSTSE